MYNDYLQVIITLVTACNTYRSHTGKGVAVAFFCGLEGEGGGVDDNLYFTFVKTQAIQGFEKFSL